MTISSPLLKIKYFLSVLIITLFCWGCDNASEMSDFEQINDCLALGGKWISKSQFCKIKTEKEDKKKSSPSLQTTIPRTNTSSSTRSTSSKNKVSRNNGTHTILSIPPKKFLGLSIAEAFQKAGQLETPFRVIEKDGKPVKLEKGFVLGRYNASTENGIIIKVTIEGRS